MLGEGRCGSEKVVRECFSGKVTFGQGLDGEGNLSDTIWGKNVPGSEDSKCKGPEVVACLACPRTIKEVMRWEKY